jgi:putative membrane protein insertion efficiency factor
VRNPLSVLAILLIKAYRAVVSPLLPPTCRFTPTCSAYAMTAIERHGLMRGGWLAVKRISRCHPWNPGGHDPVP